MQQKENHFIKNIEIKNFKCFDNFKAESFGRVNLIGGKNNVGKTAFMEAIYLNSSEENRDIYIRNIIFMRYVSDIVLDLFEEIGKRYIDNFLDKKAETYNNIEVKSNLDNLNVSTFFISSLKANKNNYEEYYGYIIKNELENKLDAYIKELDNSIEKFRIIKGEPFCQKDGKFYSLNEFGEGLNKFIFYILILLSQNNKIVLIDEIDNGIHHSKLDKLWNIILTLAKEQNVQVFATTHSDECIRALVTANTKDVKTYQLKEHILEDGEIKFIELGRTNGKVDSIIFDFKELENEVAQNMEIRGW